MKYREAKLLKEGDQVFHKESGKDYIVSSLEIYGNVKTVRVNCITTTNDKQLSFLNSELKD